MGGLRYNNMAIFYIPHDQTLTYLMRNSKHRASVELSSCLPGLWLGLRRVDTWQSGHVLRAPNDVFICNHILLRTHYTVPVSQSRPIFPGLSGNHLDCVCFGSWLRSLGLVTAVNPDTDIGDEESLETRQTSPTASGPGRSNTNICSQGRRRERDKTAKKSEMPCLTLSEWPSKESLGT